MTRYIAFQPAVAAPASYRGAAVAPGDYGGRPRRLLCQLAARSGILPALEPLTDYY
jgi:hypothetical protein